MSDGASSLHLAVALDGAGWHPAAWREPSARPSALFRPEYWIDLVQEAERGLLDFVTFEDGFSLQSDTPFVPDERTDQVRGRLDAVLVASRVAPTTRHIGLIPTVIATHTEPFHVSKAIATLDFVSSGRAGLRIKVSARHDEARSFGRRDFPPASPVVADRVDDRSQQLVRDLFDEAADYVEVLRRLWDSWEDDAEIRDVRTGRFIDRDKLHYIDFAGRWFSVKGPSITPRPPQGQPIVAALGHSKIPYRLLGRAADVGFVTPRSAAHAARLVEIIHEERALAGRAASEGHVFADLLVFLADNQWAAVERRQRLDALADSASTSDALTFAGTPSQLADLLEDWSRTGISGFRLRPATLPYDLQQITRRLVPELQRRELFRTSYASDTLRGLLGFTRPRNRYAA